MEKFIESEMGLMYQDPEYDKYTFQHKADVDEGIIRSEFGWPYIIAHGDDGYCIHLGRENYKCKVRENRPMPCRDFDCRNNEKWKVWQDYEGNIINPKLVESINENGGIYPLKNKTCMKQN